MKPLPFGRIFQPPKMRQQRTSSIQDILNRTLGNEQEPLTLLRNSEYQQRTLQVGSNSNLLL